MSNQKETWHKLATQLRIDSIRCTTAAGSGHPTSSMSAADLMAVLMASHLKYDFQNPHRLDNDRLIFSKGHASPLLYSMYRSAGVISDGELLSLRKFGSRLEGHPTPLIPWVDVATGSLGQGLPAGVGMALSGKCIDKVPMRVWVLLGDSEMAEGSVWEAFDHASHYTLNNITAILDMNRLGQRGETDLGWNSAAYAGRARAFGWNAVEIDGHDADAIDRAFSEAQASRLPTLVVAKTVKGKGVSFVENVNGWHGKALNASQEADAMKELGARPDVTVTVAKPEGSPPLAPPAGRRPQMPAYDAGTLVATRQAYGDALRALGAARPDVVALDGEVSNSTFADEFGKAYPDRFFEMFIAEQQMVSAAVGFSVMKKIPFASTFAAFFTRAYDQVRMASISQAHLRLCGSHAGSSIGEDGPSQMGLEDLAMMRALQGSTVLYPSDGPSTAALVAEMADREGIVYLRTTREKTPVLYEPSESFPIGGSKVVRRSDSDRVAVIAAGITLHEAIKAHDELARSGIHVRVIDAYTVKPIDAKTLKAAARECPGGLVVVEDHWFEGGLGDAVLDAFAGASEPLPRVTKLAVTQMPGSGKPDELIDAAGISARHIVAAVKKLAG